MIAKKRVMTISKLLSMIVISILITFFSMSQIRAYYQATKSTTIGFTTEPYSNLTFSLDKTTYPSGNNSATVKLTVNNPNAYNVTYQLSFSNTNCTYTIDGAAATTYTVNASSSKTNTIVISGATGTSITITIAAKTPYSATHTKVVNFDNSNPTVSDIGGGTTLKATSQSLTLKCTDTVGVTAYYWGTTEPTAASAITTTTSADLTALASTSGLSKSVTEAGTYWLACKDAAGNFAKKSIVIRKYQVQTVLETIAGATETYTSANYATSGSAATYYVKNGTTLTLSSIYTIPTGAASGTFKGYTTSAPSTTAQTPSTTNPTVAANNTTVYYMWFNRSTYTITVNSGANGSTKIEAVAKGTNVTASAGGSNTMSVKYGDTVKATATPATGYGLSAWSGGYISGSTNPTTGAAITAAKTITSTFADNIAPVCTWGTWSESEIEFASTSTIVLTCTDSGSGVSTSSLTSSNFTFSNSSAYTISVTSGGTSSSRTFTVTATGLAAGGSGTLTLKASQVVDGASNGNAAKTSPSLTVSSDDGGPEITFGTNGNTTYAKSQSTIVTVTDPSGVSTRKYLWTQTAGASASSGTSFTSGNTITKNTVDGAWYLCIYATDTLGNASNECSNAFYLDNTAPTITADSAIYVKQGTSIAFTDQGTATDTGGSGLSTYTAKVGTSTNPSSLALGSHTLTFTATDGAGNTATKTSTLIVYTKIDCSTSGISEDPTNDSRCIFRGANPNNYIKFGATYSGTNNMTVTGGSLYRIIGVEENKTIKIIRSAALETRAWNGSTSTTWASSSLRTYLNTDTSGNYYYTLNTQAKNHIQATKFNVGTMNYYNSSSNTIANTVTAENTTQEANASYVGIPNVYDHLLASSNCNAATKWTEITKKTNGNFTCDVDNWMVYTTDKVEEWFITPYSSSRVRRWLSPGCTTSGNGCESANSGSIQYAAPTTAKDIRPTIYLKETVIIIGGNGTSSDPYILAGDKFISDTSAATCTVTTPSGYDESKTLTITATANGATGITYSWDGSSFSSTNTRSVSIAGTYWGYIKDSQGKTNKCSIVINSRTEYRSASCTPSYGSWVKGTSQCCGQESVCTNHMTYTKTYAENNGLLYYYLCGASSDCDYETGYAGACTKYTRSCSATNCGSYGAWGTTSMSSTCSRKVETRTTYGT